MAKKFYTTRGQNKVYWQTVFYMPLPENVLATEKIFGVIMIAAIPNASSNIGRYQFLTVISLKLFGVDKTLATGFSITVLTVPLWILDLLAISRSGMTIATA